MTGGKMHGLYAGNVGIFVLYCRNFKNDNDILSLGYSFVFGPCDMRAWVKRGGYRTGVASTNLCVVYFFPIFIRLTLCSDILIKHAYPSNKYLHTCTHTDTYIYTHNNNETTAKLVMLMNVI